MLPLCWASVGRADVDVMEFLGTSPCACGYVRPLLSLWWPMLGILFAYVGHMLDLLGLRWAYVFSLLGLCWLSVGRADVDVVVCLSTPPHVGAMLGLCWLYVGPLFGR